MKEIYSRAVEAEKGTIVQVSEYVEGQLLITIAYTGPDKLLLRRELMLTQDEALVIGALLDDRRVKTQN